MSTEFQDETSFVRPTFITVLCILTFIGSGWGLIGGGISYFTADKTASDVLITQKKTAADIKQKGKDDAAGRMANKMVGSLSTAFTAENLKKAGLASVVAALLCLAGAFLMWQLKKPGYYIYIAGTLAGIVSPFLIYGTDNIMSILTSVMTGFVGIIFVILYGVNLKYMR